MKQGEIKIAAAVEGYFPAGDCEFDVTVSKGSIAERLHFYGTVNDWQALGKRLINFPLSVTDRVRFELESKALSTYLVLSAYCYDEVGHTALAVIMSKEEDEPRRYRLDFSIPAEAASINSLGHLLLNWQVENGSEIIWEAQIS